MVACISGAMVSQALVCLEQIMTDVSWAAKFRFLHRRLLFEEAHMVLRRICQCRLTSLMR